MVDTHCHLDLYSDPSRIAADAEKAGVFTVFVTNLPSAFDAALPHARQFRKVRMALGLHPLTAESHSDRELDRFKQLVWKTSFIGEVGLDFSRDGLDTREKQLNSFRFVLRCLENQAKFVTIHSRQAESAVLDLLDELYRHPVVFHWYSGTPKNLDSAIDRGHFFSVNPSMLRGMKGRKLIARIPPERILTESDGPFISVGRRKVIPADVQLVERGLAEIWEMEPLVVRSIVAQNFQILMKPLRETRSVHTDM
jgi:TatD DNase family protein